VKQVSYGKKREADNCTTEIEIMTSTVLQSPLHPGKQVKSFTDMSKNDEQQTSGA
jgi:hypothetical protein